MLSSKNINFSTKKHLTFQHLWSPIMVLCLALIFISPQSQAEIKPGKDLFKNLLYRNLGPFRAGAWIGDIAVPENPGLEHKYTV